MKSRAITLAGLFFALGSFGQTGGRVDWDNTSSTLIYTNDCNGTLGGISGNNAYRFGLYAGPFGSPADSLILMAVATNGGGLGRFTAPTLSLPPGFPPGTPITVQVRGWSLFAGATYQEALAAVISGATGVYLGTSEVGYVTPTVSPFPIPSVFGGGPGQVSGFELQSGPCRQLAIRRIAPDGPTRIIHAGRDGLLLWTNMTNIATYRLRGNHTLDASFTNVVTITGTTSVVTHQGPSVGPNRFYDVEWMDAPLPDAVGTWDYQAFDSSGAMMVAGVFTFTSNVPSTVSRNFSNLQVGSVGILQSGTGAMEAYSGGRSNLIELSYGGAEFRIRGQMVYDYFAGDWFVRDGIINPPPGGPYFVIHGGRFVALRR